jgi:predicted dinucleotide-binding enzyme
MKIGIIGAGTIGTVLAKKLIAAGYRVEISNSRGPNSLEGLVNELGTNAKAVDTKTTAANEIVILAVRWADVEQTLKKIAAPLTGKILIDVTNPVIGLGEIADLHGSTSSEVVASYVPGTQVVKAFNTLKGQWLNDSLTDINNDRVVFLSGNDARANTKVAQMITDMGFTPIELGNLSIGGMVQEYGKPLALKNLLLI